MTYEDRLVMKRYLVSGRRAYRWHKPGAVFEARLDPDAEKRAIERGAIRVLDVINANIKQEDYTLPNDWPRAAADATPAESPVGGSRVS